MDENILQLAASEVWDDRARAAQLVAGHDDPESEALVLRLLRDPTDTDVTQVAVAAVLAQRGIVGVRLILRSLGQDEGRSSLARATAHADVRVSTFALAAQAAVAARRPPTNPSG